MLLRLFRNHVLANLLFGLVIVMGVLSYSLMPREQDPTINFNWIDITTVQPGAATEDVEKRITDVIEEAVRKVPDIKFVSSTSRKGVSSILARFNDDIGDDEFDKRLTDLRREIQNKEDELPDEAESPVITEVTTANAFPSATLVVTSPADDENLRRQAEIVKKSLERISGVDQVLDSGLNDPELQALFIPERLESQGISPITLADTIRAVYRDFTAGTARVNDQNWAVRLSGSSSDANYLASLPISTPQGEVPLGTVADVVRARAKASRLVRYNGQPAVMMAITKQASANTLELVADITDYIESRNRFRNGTGVDLVLIDDQTEITRNALSIMQTNALLGLGLVLIVTWVFLGSRIAALTSIGIPFVLAGTFWLLSGIDQTLNVSILLGVVISLGMLVDDAVVVVESIYYRLERGMEVSTATLESLKEVFAPVTSAVLTTMAVFLPLMLLPGILGKFMLIIPLVVTTALAISLVEAYWMLPAHVIAAKVSFSKPSRVHRMRVSLLRRIRLTYTRMLLKVMRVPFITFAGAVLLFIAAIGGVAGGFVKIDFFASDPLRLYYVNIEMPRGTPLDKTMDKILQVEDAVRKHIRAGELREIASYAGQLFTETAPLIGEQYGQILVALTPKTQALRNVDEMIEAMRADVSAVPGPERISFLRLAGGPPTSKPISIKVRGDEFAEIRAAADELRTIMSANPAILDVGDDDSPGQQELVLRVNQDAALRADLNPTVIARTTRLLVDGEVVASMQDQGEKLDIRVRARSRSLNAIDELLRYTLTSGDGSLIALSELVHAETRQGRGNIRHYNFRRAITVEADIDKAVTNTVEANQQVVDEWNAISARYPNIDLDFSGELDDINESIGAIKVLFLLGVGLMYLILGTQFRSYFQPLMILATIPLAFTGVVLGLWITGDPLSLYTMYGVVALAGIAVNTAIVLISAANARLEAGMSVLHATVYAARRRVVPVIITSMTTIAGLFSLAIGLGGHSLLWGPVATAIVWGLLVSTLLTLFVVPLLYRLFMRAPKSPTMHLK